MMEIFSQKVPLFYVEVNYLQKNALWVYGKYQRDLLDVF
jgi:hypothetical protein